MALIAILAIPLLAALLCWVPPLRRVAWGITVASTSTVFALAVYVSAEVIASRRVVGVPGWFEADGLSALVLVLVGFVCALACIFAGGYMRHSETGQNRLWWFYCNYNLFLFALIFVPSLAETNLVWVGVSMVTLFAVLLVGFERTTERVGGCVEVCNPHDHGIADLTVRVLHAVLGVPFRDRRFLGDLGRSSDGRIFDGPKFTEDFLSPGVCRIRG